MPQATSFWWSLLASALIFGNYLFAEQDNFSWRLVFVLGLCCLPYVFRLAAGERSFRFLWPTLGLLAVLLFVRSSTVFYLASSMAVLFCWEASLGKRSWLAFCLLAVMSPFVGNMAYVWSFPIRLQLSQWATAALRGIGFPAEAAGNIVLLNGQEFAVDPACMGLQMLVTALVLAIFLLARVEQQRQQAFSLFTIAASLLTMLLLAVGANFIRLLTLILFRILPANPLHDAVGLLSLFVYALLPFYAFWRWRNQAFQSSPSEQFTVSAPAKWQRWAYALVIVGLCTTGLQFRKTVQANTASLAQLDISGYEAQFGEFGVLQLTAADALVYIKPPVRAFQGGHDPRICWQGSGYEFTKIDTFTIGSHTIYQAELAQQDEPLYTAWWYDNGHTKTISEWQWRWQTLQQQERFYLVNITSSTPEKLQEKLTLWMDAEYLEKL